MPTTTDTAATAEIEAVAAGPMRRLRPADVVLVSGAGRLVVGDVALRSRGDLEGAGCVVGVDGWDAHDVSAVAACRHARRAAAGTERDLAVPDHLRKPGAVRSKP